VKKTQSQLFRVDADNALRVFHPRELQRVRHPTGIGLIIVAADHRRADGYPDLNLMMMLGAHDVIAVRSRSVLAEEYPVVKAQDKRISIPTSPL